MDTLLWIVIIAAIVVAGVCYMRQRGVTAARSLEDAQAEARRWVERLGGQVYSLDPKDDPPRGRRWPTRPSGSPPPARRSSRPSRCSSTGWRSRPPTRACTTCGPPARRSASIPGPELPAIPGQQQAGAVYRGPRGRPSRATSTRPRRSPGDGTQHYYPGGMVAGRPVPRGWYSEPWWKPALVAGAWGVGTYLVASTLFAGMAHRRLRLRRRLRPGLRRRQGDGGDGGGDAGGDAGAVGDYGGGGGDFGGGDFGGGDFGGF